MLLPPALHNRLRQGPLSVAEYMAHCLYHPQEGYYMRGSVLGRQGDFITAPEVTQLFGEMIALWVIQQWQKLGQPAAFILLEGGPGHGTLMADILRTLNVVPACAAAVQPVLLEVSPGLRARQQQAVSHPKARWIEHLHELPAGLPVIMVANELLDAFPVQQYVRLPYGSYAVRQAVLQPDETLAFGIGGGADINGSWPIEEHSPAMEGFVRALAQRVNAALLIDYGYLRPPHMPPPQHGGDTLQAVKNHTKVHPLAHPTQADLTTLVNFSRVATLLGAHNVSISTQGAFLSEYGLPVRAAQLMQTATAAQGGAIQSALHRLTDPSQMGELFKVLSYTNRL